MAKRSKRAVSSTVIWGQCFAAVGRGLGSRPLARDGAEILVATYDKALVKNQGKWDQDEGAILGLALSIGEVAATVARDDGAAAVGASHVKEALKRLGLQIPPRRKGVLRECPWCQDPRARRRER
jgi:hypothetical protein